MAQVKINFGTCDVSARLRHFTADFSMLLLPKNEKGHLKEAQAATRLLLKSISCERCERRSKSAAPATVIVPSSEGRQHLPLSSSFPSSSGSASDGSWLPAGGSSRRSPRWIWTLRVSRSRSAPVRRSEPSTSVHFSNGRLVVTIRLSRS